MGTLHTAMRCPSLDILCGGGVPHESIVYLYGGPGLGKTTVALNMLGAMPPGGVWVDGGHCLHHAYAQQEACRSMTVIYPAPTTDSIHYLSGLVGATPIVVIDDLTAISDGMARPLEAFMREVKELLPGSGTTIVLTNHVRQCKNGYLPPGGLSYSKYADLVLELGPTHKRTGDRLTVDVRIVKSTVGPCQGQRGVHFRHGLDRVWDTITSAVRAGVVHQAGSWYTYRDHKRQGLEALEQALTRDDIENLYEEVMRCY